MRGVCVCDVVCVRVRVCVCGSMPKFGCKMVVLD